jgi:hypothetical protein
MEDLIRLSAEIRPQNAQKHLNSGAGRRAKAIWHSMGTLLRTIEPNRTSPLSRDQVEDASRDLNVIYINIRGLMDNLAWVLKHVFDLKARNKEVGLFRKSFLAHPSLADLSANLQVMRNWETDLSRLRDPAAHRIPLTIPPAFLNPEELLEFQAIMQARETEQRKALESISADEDPTPHFERVNQLFDQAERLGSFRPLFCHDEDDGLFWIYPTIAEDVGKMIIVAKFTMQFIRESISSRQSSF